MWEVANVSKYTYEFFRLASTKSDILCREESGQKYNVWSSVFPLRKFYTEQIFVLVSMQLRNHVDAQLVKRFKRWKAHAIYIQC